MTFNPRPKELNFSSELEIQKNSLEETEPLVEEHRTIRVFVDKLNRKYYVLTREVELQVFITDVMKKIGLTVSPVYRYFHNGENLSISMEPLEIDFSRYDLSGWVKGFATFFIIAALFGDSDRDANEGLIQDKQKIHNFGMFLGHLIPFDFNWVADHFGNKDVEKTVSRRFEGLFEDIVKMSNSPDMEELQSIGFDPEKFANAVLVEIFNMLDNCEKNIKTIGVEGIALSAKNAKIENLNNLFDYPYKVFTYESFYMHLLELIKESRKQVTSFLICDKKILEGIEILD